MIYLGLLGAVLLSALDAVHTHTHTESYAHPTFFLAAWWVPLLFGTSAAIGGKLYADGYERLGGPATLPPPWAIARGLFAMSALYAASGLLPATAATKLVVLATGAGVLFFTLDGSRVGALLVAIGAVVGPLFEATLVHLGLFRYHEPDLLGVPMWLPALYACVVPPMGQLARVLRRRASPRRAPEREAPAP